MPRSYGPCTEHEETPRPARPKPPVPFSANLRHSGRMSSGQLQSRAGALEVRSIDYVPLSERHGRVWHLGPLWFMSNAQIATLAVGLISITEGASVFWSVVSIAVGTLAGTLFMAFHSAQGPKLGLPQMIQSRPQFGYYGALLPVVVAVLLFIGFNVFNTQIGEQMAVETLNVNKVVGA